MTAPTLVRSAYPAAVAELMPAARIAADEAGGIPSRNALMKALKIGAPKATQVRDALAAERAGTHPTAAAAIVEPAASPAGAAADPVADPGPGTAVTESDTNPTDPGPGTPATPIRSATDAPESIPAPAGVRPAADPAGSGAPSVPVASPLADLVADPDPKVTPVARKPLAVWPVWVLALPAIVAIWSGWVGLGELAGFGMVRPLPGIADGFAFNSAITLPVGMEVYAAYALRVWLSGSVPAAAKRFAKVSALGSLALGSLGQIAYHLMTASGVTTAPWPITTAVACLPVAVLGMGATLAHLLRNHD